MVISTSFTRVTVALLLAPISALAQQPTPDLAARVDRVFARFGPNSPGCAVGLAKNGETLYTHGYGSANLEYGVPLTDSTVLESGSVAKQFTAAAIVMLVADGKLRLTDDIRKYLPEVPAFGGQTITIHNLLTHTSGLRDQWGLLGIEGHPPGSQVHSPMTTLDLVAHQKMLNFPPGSAYLYSNTGYALAGLIVQRVSGKSLDAFMQERFFRPLGMTHTQWRDDFTEVVRNRATAYSGSEANGFHQDMPFTNMIGNGGLLSTMSDLLKWNENLDHPTIGGPSFATAMQTPMRLTNGRTISYALGLAINDHGGVREISHDGSTAGYRTYLARFPDQRVSVAVWCNYASASPATLGHEVVDLVLEKKPANAAEPHAVTADVPESEVARWAATYRNVQTDQVTTFVVQNNTLRSPQTGGRGGSIIYTPEGDARFRGPAGEAVFSRTAGRRGFILIRSDGDTARFEEVRPTPSPLKLSDYVGTYTSDELDAVLTIAEHDGKLVLRRRPADEYELQPVYADDFRASGGGLGTLRFSRDARGSVTGFSFYAGRVLDVRFTRRRPTG